MSRNVRDTRLATALGLTLLLSNQVLAQTPAPKAPVAPMAPAPPVAPAAPVPLVASEQPVHQTFGELQRILNDYPPAVRQVLSLDHSLLTRPDYLSVYPGLQAFLAQHP